MILSDVKTMDDVARRMGLTFDGLMARRVSIDAVVPVDDACTDVPVADAWPSDFDASGQRIFGICYLDGSDHGAVHAAALAVQVFRLRENLTDAPTGVFGPFPEDGNGIFVILGHDRVAVD